MAFNTEVIVMRTAQLTRYIRRYSFLFAGAGALLIGSLAIAQTNDSLDTGLSSQSGMTSPYSTTPPFVTPIAPAYGGSQNVSPFMNSPALTLSSPTDGTRTTSPTFAPSSTAPMPGPSDADIVSGTTMSSQAGSTMSTQTAPTSNRAPASVQPSSRSTGTHVPVEPVR